MLAKARYFSDQVAKAVNDIPRLKRKTMIKKGNAQVNIRCYARVYPTQSHKSQLPPPYAHKESKKNPKSQIQTNSLKGSQSSPSQILAKSLTFRKIMLAFYPNSPQIWLNIPYLPSPAYSCLSALPATKVHTSSYFLASPVPPVFLQYWAISPRYRSW
jgi:hypothetical protein